MLSVTVVGVAYLIKVAFHNVHITGKSLEIVVGLLGTEVSCAEDVLDFARHLTINTKTSDRNRNRNRNRNRAVWMRIRE